jgi:hypothetical protein
MIAIFVLEAIHKAPIRDCGIQIFYYWTIHRVVSYFSRHGNFVTFIDVAKNRYLLMMTSVI